MITTLKTRCAFYPSFYPHFYPDGPNCDKLGCCCDQADGKPNPYHDYQPLIVFSCVLVHSGSFYLAKLPDDINGRVLNRLYKNHLL